MEWKNRTFKMWKYSVSLNTLLLRSLEDGKDTIDFLFRNVQEINIPTTFTICDYEIKDININLSKHIFKDSNMQAWSVVALPMQVFISDMKYNELSNYFDHSF